MTERRVAVVTGANAGIGRETALGLARLGLEVVLLCRDPQRGEAAREAIARQSGNAAISLLLCDLASGESIRQAGAELRERYGRLHILVNNAALIPRRRLVGKDGLERQFAVNHLAYFQLTLELLDLLRGGGSARIVNVSSNAHRGMRVDFDDLQSERNYRARRVYGVTKLMNVLFTYELARRLERMEGCAGVTVNCLHPGVIATGLLSAYTGLPGLLKWVFRVFFSGPDRGARTSLHVAAAPEVEGVSGRYFDNGRQVDSSPESHDEQAAARLWQISEELVAGR